MIVTTLVTAYLFIGAICTIILVSACIVSGRSEERSESLSSTSSQEAELLQPVKQAATNSRRTHAHPA